MKININAKKNSAEILLYEDVGGWFGISAKDFINQVKSAGSVETINLRINSNGGSVFDGLSIYNYLSAHQANIVVDIDGLAASIASLIALSGDEVRIASNAWMMIHDPWSIGIGTASDLRTMADQLDNIRDSILDTYMKRSTEKRDQVSDLMSAETWLDAKRSQEIGFADSITGEMKMAAAANKDWFVNIPDQLKNQKQRTEITTLLARMDNTSRRYRTRRAV